MRRVQVKTLVTDYTDLQNTLGCFSRPVCGNLKIPIVSNTRDRSTECFLWPKLQPSALHPLVRAGDWQDMGLGDHLCLCTGPFWSMGVPGCP